MKSPPRPPLSRREREIMEVVYRFDGATAADVAEHLPEPPSYSAVRALLSILVGKGHLRHETRGNRYVYLPTVPRAQATRGAMRALVQTFFGGSPKDAVVALLDEGKRTLSPDDLAEIRSRIDEALEKGK